MYVYIQTWMCVHVCVLTNYLDHGIHTYLFRCFTRLMDMTQPVVTTFYAQASSKRVTQLRSVHPLLLFQVMEVVNTR